MKLINKFFGPAVLILSVIALLVMFLNYDSEPAKQGPATDIGLQYAYVLLIVAVLGIIAGFVLTAISDPSSILTSAAGVIFILVIWGISYSVSGNEVTKIYQEFKVDAGLSQMIGSFLTLTSTLGILAILGIIITEVMSAVR
jgi:hypothetical protein